MDVSKLAQLDLNLLVHLQVLLEECHVSRAAQKLGSSQPVLSRSLSALRAHFADPLLVRSGNALVPTERAKALRPDLEALLHGVERLAHDARFDPAEASGRICVSAPDVVALLLLPALLERLARLSPGLDVEIVPWQSDWRRPLERGDIDLTVGFPTGDEPGLHARVLLVQEWAVVLRRGHPALRKRWTPELYASLPHVLVTAAGRGASAIDEALAARGLSRRVVLRVPYPLVAPLIVSRTDVVVTTLHFLAHQIASRDDVVVKKPPVPVPAVRVPMVWHERSHRDPRHRWLRDQLRAAADVILAPPVKAR